MPSYNNVLCVGYVIQITIGHLGNYLLLYLYGSNVFTAQRKKPIDLIVINLAFSNILLLLIKGVTFAMQACMQEIVLYDIGCKIIIYLQRVSRGLSLCTTCLLCVFQAITISPFSSKCSKLKASITKFIVPSCAFIWLPNLLLDVVVLLYVTGNNNNTNSKLKRNLGYCYIDKNAMKTSKLVIWKSLYDAVFVALMGITCGYMVLVLYKHHRKVQHILNPRLTRSPEINATKAILLLMSIFVCFYSVSSIFVIVMDNSKDTNQWVIHISVFFSLCYPALSPFVLISCDSQIFRLSCFFIAFKRTKNFITVHKDLRIQNNGF